MALRSEKWTRLEVDVTLEAPRKTGRFNILFVSPGGLFVPCNLDLDAYAQVTVRFKVESRPVVAHAEVRRVLTTDDAHARGISYQEGGLEMRIVRMEGDGSQILAEHIKKVMMESGGPA